MKIKQRIKNYFTDKPKGDFWFHAFITLFLLRYVGPLAVMFIIFFQVGLLAPEVDATIAIQNSSIKIAESYTTAFSTILDAGSKIGTENPIIAKVLAFVLSNFVYVVWFAGIALILNLARYGISWIYRRVKLK